MTRRPPLKRADPVFWLSVKLYYCDDHVIPLPAGHKFPTQKYRLLRELLASDGNFEFEAAPLRRSGDDCAGSRSGIRAPIPGGNRRTADHAANRVPVVG